MGKLKLRIEELRVDGFVTEGAAGGEGGTVRGFAQTNQFSCLQTCAATCYQTCKCTTVTQPEVTCLYECPSEGCTPTCV